MTRAPRARRRVQRRQRARVPRRVRRRGRLVPLAVRPAARPRLPVDGHRARPRRRCRTSRACTRAASSARPRCSSPGSARCSCGSGSRPAASANCCATTRACSRACRARCMLAMALFLLGSLFLRAPWLYQEKRFHPQLGRFGDAAPAVAGVAFGFGWSPCIGPILGSILGIAANRSTACGRAARCSPSTRSASGCRSSLTGLAARPARRRARLGEAPLRADRRRLGRRARRVRPAVDVRPAVAPQRAPADWLTDAHLRWLVELGIGTHSGGTSIFLGRALGHFHQRLADQLDLDVVGVLEVHRLLDARGRGRCTSTPAAVELALQPSRTSRASPRSRRAARRRDLRAPGRDRARGSRRTRACCRRRCRRRSATSLRSRGSRTARRAGSRARPGRSGSCARDRRRSARGGARPRRSTRAGRSAQELRTQIGAALLEGREVAFESRHACIFARGSA